MLRSIFGEESCGGWVSGRIKPEPTTLGRKKFTNGIITICAFEKPEGSEWKRGQCRRYSTSGNKALRSSYDSCWILPCNKPASNAAATSDCHRHVNATLPSTNL